MKRGEEKGVEDYSKVGGVGREGGQGREMFGQGFVEREDKWKG